MSMLVLPIVPSMNTILLFISPTLVTTGTFMLLGPSTVLLQFILVCNSPCAEEKRKHFDSELPL